MAEPEPAQPVRVERVGVEAIRPLRRAVLRPTRPPEKSVYPQDDGAQTVHLAAFDEVGQAVGCATVFPEAYGDEPLAWRLRGMATVEHLRGHGVGGAVLFAAIRAAADGGAPLLWCNAREKAQRFYERYGFVGEGELFDVPVAGPHRVMYRRLP